MRKINTPSLSQVAHAHDSLMNPSKTPSNYSQDLNNIISKNRLKTLSPESGTYVNGLLSEKSITGRKILYDNLELVDSRQSLNLNKFPIMLDSAKNAKLTPKYRGLYSEGTNFMSSDALPKENNYYNTNGFNTKATQSASAIRRPVSLKEKSSLKTEHAPKQRPLVLSSEPERRKLAVNMSTHPTGKPEKIVSSSNYKEVAKVPGVYNYQKLFENSELKRSDLKRTRVDKYEHETEKRSTHKSKPKQAEKTDQEKEIILKQSMNEYKRKLINQILSENIQEVPQEFPVKKSKSTPVKRSKKKSSKKVKANKLVPESLPVQVIDSQSPTKKRKKTKENGASAKKRKKSKRKQIETKEQEPAAVITNDRNQQLYKLMKKSLESLKIEKELRKKVEEENKRIKDQKFSSLQKTNELIRRKNAQRFASKTSKVQPQVPWGYDQKKVINQIRKFYESLLYKETSRKNIKRIEDDKRRELLGVGFLNHLSDGEVQELKMKSKVSKIPENYQPTAVEETEINDSEREKENLQTQLYMEYKRHQNIEKTLMKSIEEHEKKERIKKNLESLDRSVKEIFHSTTLTNVKKEKKIASSVRKNYQLENRQLDEQNFEYTIPQKEFSSRGFDERFVNDTPGTAWNHQAPNKYAGVSFEGKNTAKAGSKNFEIDKSSKSKKELPTTQQEQYSNSLIDRRDPFEMGSSKLGSSLAQQYESRFESNAGGGSERKENLKEKFEELSKRYKKISNQKIVEDNDNRGPHENSNDVSEDREKFSRKEDILKDLSQNFDHPGGTQNTEPQDTEDRRKNYNNEEYLDDDDGFQNEEGDVEQRDLRRNQEIEAGLENEYENEEYANEEIDEEDKRESEAKSSKRAVVPLLKLPRKPDEISDEELLKRKMGEINSTQGANAPPHVEDSQKKKYHHQRVPSEVEYDYQNQIKSEQDPRLEHEEGEGEENEEEGEEEGEEVEDEDDEQIDSETLRRNLEFFGSIATLIQKVWRGYRTRKILREYFEFILNNEMYEGEEGEDYEEDYDEDETMDDEREREELQRHFLIHQRNIEQMYGLNHMQQFAAVPYGHGQPGNEVILEDEMEYQLESTTHTQQQISQPRSLQSAPNNRRNRSLEAENRDEYEESGDNHRIADSNGRILDGMDLYEKGSDISKGKTDLHALKTDSPQGENEERNIIYDKLESMEEYNDDTGFRPKTDRNEDIEEEEDDDQPTFQKILKGERIANKGSIEESQSVEKMVHISDIYMNNEDEEFSGSHERIHVVTKSIGRNSNISDFTPQQKGKIHYSGPEKLSAKNDEAKGVQNFQKESSSKKPQNEELKSQQEEEALKALNKLREAEIQRWESIIKKIENIQKGDEPISGSSDIFYVLQEIQKQSETNRQKLIIDFKGDSNLAISDTQSYEKREIESMVEGEHDELKSFKIAPPKQKPHHTHSPAGYGQNHLKNLTIETYENKNDIEVCHSYEEDVKDKGTEEARKNADSNIGSPKTYFLDKERVVNTDDKRVGHAIEYEHELFQTPTSRNYVANTGNNNISEIRKTLGSERIVREQSLRNISQSWSSPSMKYQLSVCSKGRPSGRSEYHEYLDLDLKESISSKDMPERMSSIFDQDPFQEFTGKVYNSLLHSKENAIKVRKVREETLKMLDNKEHSLFLKQKSTSPKTVNRKRIELEVWVSKEKEDVKKASKSKDSLMKLTPEYTQRDIYLRKKMVGTSDSVGCFSENEDNNEYQNQERVNEVDVDISKSWSNPNGQRLHINQNILKDFDTPGSSKNIKIIDQFEIRDGGSSSGKEHIHSKFSLENKKSGGTEELADSLSLGNSAAQRLKPMGLSLEEGVLSESDLRALTSKEGSVIQRSSYENDLFELSAKSDISRHQRKYINICENESPAKPARNPESEKLFMSPGQREDVDEFAFDAKNSNSPIMGLKNKIKGLPKVIGHEDLHHVIEEEARRDRYEEKQDEEEEYHYEYDQHEKIKMKLPDEVRDSGGSLLDKKIMIDSKTNEITGLILDELIQEFIQTDNFDRKLQQAFEEARSDDMQLVTPGRLNTSLRATEEYLVQLCLFIKENFSEEVKRNINKPYDEEDVAKLRLLNEHKFDKLPQNFTIKPGDILAENIFYEFQELFEADGPTQKTASKELSNYHNRVLFDCLNESLELFRPYDIRGKPLIWKTNNKKTTYSLINEDNIDLVLNQARDKVIEWAAHLCGYLNEPRLCSSSCILEEDALLQLKQERLERLLSAEVYEKEEKWLCYDDEETLVNMEITQLILDDLVSETVDFLREKMDK